MPLLFFEKVLKVHKHLPILVILARNIKKKLDTDDFSSDHLTLMLLLHYHVKCRSCSLTIYNNEFILDSARIGSEMIN